MLLNVACCLFLAGVTSNIIDRAYYGHVRDYINVFSDMFFNIADIFILVGFFLIIFSIFKYADTLWYPKTERKLNLHLSKEQMVFSSKLFLVLSFYFLIVVLFCISFFTAYNLPRNINIIFIFGLVFLSLIFNIIIFFISTIIFQQLAGPIIALENFVDDLNQGIDRNFTIRKGDYFKRLIIISAKIKQLTQNKNIDK